LKSFQEYLAVYSPSEKGNDDLWEELTDLVNSVPYLSIHRDWVEKHSWGFGDRAFHYMWYLILAQDILKSNDPFLLEIGVYKGQVISLWSLIALNEGGKANIYAISPLSGTGERLPPIAHEIWLVINKKYREDFSSGNLYKQMDYLRCIEQIFSQFNLTISSIHLLQGSSQDKAIQAKLSYLTFDLVYIDGSHTYQDVSNDIDFYGDRVKVGGYLILDDASYFQPGTLFWKGHKNVSRAAEDIDKNRFTNILNVGHNRIYKRLL